MKKTVLFLLALQLVGCKVLNLSNKNSSNGKSNSTSDLHKWAVNNNVDTTRTNNYEIVYDFKTGLYEKNNLQLKVNTPVIFRIKNINRLAYEVKISSKDSILAETFISELPISIDSKSKEEGISSDWKTKSTNVIFTSNNFGLTDLIAKEDVKNDKIISFKNDFSNLITLIPEINELDAKKNKLESDLQFFRIDEAFYIQEIEKLTKEKKALDIKKNDTDDSNINEMISYFETTIDKLKIEKKSKTEEIQQLETSIIALKRDIKLKSDLVTNEAIRKYNLDNQALQETFRKLKDSYIAILNLHNGYIQIKTIANIPNLSKNVYLLEHKNTIYPIAKKILLQREVLINFKSNFDELISQYNHIYYNPYLSDYFTFGGKVKLYSQVDHLKQLAERYNKEVGSLNVQSLMEKIDHLLVFLENDDAYTVESAPIQPLNDVAIFDISIKKHNENGAVISNDKKFRHREFTYGGTRIDFSIGLAASYFSDTPVYELGSVLNYETNERETRILRKSENLVVPSLIGLVTMSYRKTGYVTFGGSAGLGIDVVDGKVQLSNFFAGPTILFGKFERMFLSFGPTFRDVGTLRGGYNPNDLLPSGSSDINDYITTKYKVGYFASLTYNLTKGAKDNYKKLKQL
ncbi:hypothetical protein [Flavobacterium sp.]|uniref:hypothetical protein n=1 Tax=Flavobacterium sp. TaxID=239 RepID=UPI002FD9480B